MPYSTDQLRARYNSQTTLFAGYTAGAGTMVVVDGSLLPTAVPFAILVTRASDGLARPFTCTALAGNTLTVAVSEGQADDLNFLAGDAVENIVAADAQERLRGFALGHTHTGGNDGPALSGGGVTDHALLTNVTANQHHAQSHSISGADHSGQLAHTALTSIGTNTHPQIDTHLAATATHGATAAVVGTDNTQTLTNKTLTTPTIGDYTNAQHLHTNAASGGAISGAPAFATPSIALGTAPAAGAAGTIIRSDSTLAAFDATVPSTQAFGDAAATGSIAFAARRDHKHAMPANPTPAFATPAVVLGTTGAAGAAATVIRSDSTIAAFDATAPTTSAEDDVAATGSTAFAARRDHVHGREAARPEVTNSIASASTITLPAGKDLIAVISGTTTITAINTPALGRRVTCYFVSAGCRVTSGANLIINGGDYVSAASGSLTLIAGATGWWEVARSPQFVPRAHAYSTTNLSINDQVNTAIVMNSERYDTDTIHDTSTNTERLTCKTAGVYLITGAIAFAANATGYRQARLYWGAGTIIAIQLQPAANGTETVCVVSTQYALAVNDYVWLAGFHNVGSAINSNADPNYGPWIAMAWVGP